METPEREWESANGLFQLQSLTDQLLIRLEEFEAHVNAAKQDAQTAKDNLAVIASRKEELYAVCKRIDDLERFIELIDANVNQVGRQVEVAEEELGVTDDSRITSLFKSVFSKKRKGETNLNASKEYVPVEVLKTSEFFQEREAKSLEEIEAELGVEMGELNEDFLE